MKTNMRARVQKANESTWVAIHSPCDIISHLRGRHYGPRMTHILFRNRKESWTGCQFLGERMCQCLTKLYKWSICTTFSNSHQTILPIHFRGSFVFWQGILVHRQVAPQSERRLWYPIEFHQHVKIETTLSLSQEVTFTLPQNERHFLFAAANKHSWHGLTRSSQFDRLVWNGERKRNLWYSSIMPCLSQHIAHRYAVSETRSTGQNCMTVRITDDKLLHDGHRTWKLIVKLWLRKAVAAKWADEAEVNVKL